ncbi:unnamed protein product [Acanthoscelides obtectus]|uniref:FOXO protein transactivation domain-containing protein n=1 Tax=Acanthoscelides obtectus TaxID=200917 RepID=A0A9P0P6F2_ACAOB|nr:unnamed protein product [Acanthoscelides obtectus]CAK1629294.1 Forkhead box protein O [Acanthoscelides obtectus]
MRVQNEGTGKSSWWMINPDAKPGKSVRRRAASMETSKFEKKRGRAKKKVEMIRNGCLPDTTPSPSSSVSESLDLFPDSPLHRFMNGQGPQQQPPPPYTAPYEQFPGCRDLNALHATTPYGLCSIHRMQSCNCLQPIKVENMSPVAGMSPSYPHSEPSPGVDHHHQYTTGSNGNGVAPGASSAAPGGRLPRAPSNSPPLDPHSPQVSTTPAPSQTAAPSTMMGQLMGALNNHAIMDDLNINVESLPGGFECNVEELIRHELTMEGGLDFNFSNSQQQAAAAAAAAAAAVAAGGGPQSGEGGQPPGGPPPPPSYQQATVVTTPSWVH